MLSFYDLHYFTKYCTNNLGILQRIYVIFLIFFLNPGLPAKIIISNTWLFIIFYGDLNY